MTDGTFRIEHNEPKREIKSFIARAESLLEILKLPQILQHVNPSEISRLSGIAKNLIDTTKDDMPLMPAQTQLLEACELQVQSLLSQLPKIPNATKPN